MFSLVRSNVLYMMCNTQSTGALLGCPCLVRFPPFSDSFTRDSRGGSLSFASLLFSSAPPSLYVVRCFVCTHHFSRVEKLTCSNVLRHKVCQGRNLNAHRSSESSLRLRVLSRSDSRAACRWDSLALSAFLLAHEETSLGLLCGMKTVHSSYCAGLFLSQKLAHKIH